MKRMVDPPEGWKYGFPKESPDYGVDLRAWLVKQGYPEKDVDFAVKHTRIWLEG